MPSTIARSDRTAIFGTVAGDRPRLAGTDFRIEARRDPSVCGDKVKSGGGKVIRDGLGGSRRARAGGAS